MIEDTEFFVIPQTLNKPKTIGGFPLDEFIPALALGFLFFMANQILLGMGLGLAWLVGLRHFKKGRPTRFLLLGLCWRLPHRCNRLFFKEALPNEHRFFLA